MKTLREQLYVHIKSIDVRTVYVETFKKSKMSDNSCNKVKRCVKSINRKDYRRNVGYHNYKIYLERKPVKLTKIKK